MAQRAARVGSRPTETGATHSHGHAIAGFEVAVLPRNVTAHYHVLKLNRYLDSKRFEVAATLGTQLKLFANSKLLPSGGEVSLTLARWSTRLSRLAVAGVMAVAFYDWHPPGKPYDKSATPPIEILRTKRVPMDGQRPPAKLSAGH